MRSCPVPLLLVLVVFCGGCVHKDPVVEKEIQSRYEQQDSAFNNRNLDGILAFCAPEYSEINRGTISVRPKNWDTIAVSRRARQKADQETISSLSEYRTFLTEQLTVAQSLSVQSTVVSASVNSKNDRVFVTVNREMHATVPFPGSQRTIPLSVRDSLEDTWAKVPGKGWLKLDSKVTGSNTQRDRMAESAE